MKSESDTQGLSLKREQSTLERLGDFTSESGFNRFRDKVRGYFSKTKLEGSPDIKFNFFFAPHKTAEDRKNLIGAFTEADVYIPEVPGWTPRHLVDYQAIADGRITPDEHISSLRRAEKSSDVSNSTLKAELDLLYRSNKNVMFIDITSRSPIIKELRGAATTEIETSGDFPQALAQTRRMIDRFTKANLARENQMLANLKQGFDDLFKQEPELKAKDEIKVLFSLGSAHASLSQRLMQKGFDTKRTYSDLPVSFTYSSMATMRRMLNKDLDDEFTARTYLEVGLFNSTYLGHLRELTTDTNKLCRFTMHILRQFSYKDIENIYNKVKSGESFQNIFEESLWQRGIKMPQTESELDEILAFTPNPPRAQQSNSYL